jgi:hypothetical protein
MILSNQAFRDSTSLIKPINMTDGSARGGARRAGTDGARTTGGGRIGKQASPCTALQMMFVMGRSPAGHGEYVWC